MGWCEHWIKAELIFPRDYQFPFPSRLFTCASLKKLELQFCTINIPTNFRGLKLLTSLTMRHISASEDHLERLILSCPMLKILVFDYYEGTITSINVYAPNLQRLDISGAFRKLNLLTPHLNELDLRLRLPSDYDEDPPQMDAILDMTAQQRESNFRSVFGQCFHNITKIGLDRVSLMYLGYRHLGNKLSGTFQNLKCVELGFSPKCPFETTGAECFLERAHNIEMLKITFFYLLKVNSQCLKICPPGVKVCSFEDCLFPHLRILNIKQYNCFEEELAVLEHLLLVSPSLERASFAGSRYYDDEELEKLEVYVKTILGFRRASTKAEIIF